MFGAEAVSRRQTEFDVVDDPVSVGSGIAELSCILESRSAR